MPMVDIKFQLSRAFMKVLKTGNFGNVVNCSTWFCIPKEEFVLPESLPYIPKQTIPETPV
ncbi:unnamed protein product [Orchesella dallaii]|uniref:Cyclic lactone autoinducer peptide n=1 Tax=Orchesella dallaii TaxID=48710 RepID=A0ABP1RNV4_9HEXA